MDKKEFFDNLHKELGIKYNLPATIIETIRARNLTQEQILLRLEEQISNLFTTNILTIKKLAWRKGKPQQVKRIQSSEEAIKINLAFIEEKNKAIPIIKRLTSAQWQDIIQKTKFDKE